MSVRIEPIKPNIGARVYVDPARLADAEVATACREALDKYGVLVFPKIGVTDKQQLAFTDALGGRVDYSKDIDGGKDGTEDVYTVTLNPEINSQKEYVTGTFFWHIDGLNMDNLVLPKATCLSARHVAAKGGDTHFANAYAAYDALPEETKAEIEGLRVKHNLVTYLTSIVEEPTEEELARWGRNPINEWPLVWHHESGRTTMILGSTCNNVVGMDLASGLALVHRLQEWVAQPDFVYEHKWEEGDMVIWDNHGTMHRATPYDASSRREMHRTTIAGSELVPTTEKVREAA
jgi:alpha-ketoglutarate-dependent taurine dioxygenase